MALENSLHSQPFSHSFSFDDVLLKPGYSEVLPAEVQVESKLGNLPLKVPVLSAAMDTVTEAQMAIAMALMGGMGVLHKNLTIDEQASDVGRVKKFQHAVISDPITVKADFTLAQVKELIRETGITGFPVIDADGRLVGMCTGRDIRYAESSQTRVSDVMSSPVKSLAQGIGQREAVEFFRKHKVEKLPLIDREGRLRGLITSKDWRQQSDYPRALRDASGSLLVAAAIGAGGKDGIDRAIALVDSKVDCLVLDSAHGHSKGIISTLSELRKKFPQLTLMAGNVATAEGAKALIDAGANVVKIGVGPGSICTTRIVSGAGVPQLSAIWEVCRTLRDKHPDVSFIADGGIRYSGDITKALAAGAHAVMLGSLLAGTEESPGETIIYMGRSYKFYRGMGSISAMKKGSKDRYRQASVEASKLVPEGVEARVPYRGKVHDVVYQLVGGLRSGMGYVGAKNLSELYTKSQFVRISAGALKESHVHDVSIVAEAPNYSGRPKEE
jgi:IMP dehydrogenase